MSGIEIVPFKHYSWSDEGFCFQCLVDGYDPSDDSL